MMIASELISKWITFSSMIDESTWISPNQSLKSGGNGNSRENLEPKKKLTIESQKIAGSSENLAMKVEKEDEADRVKVIATVIDANENDHARETVTETVIAKENALDREIDVGQGTEIVEDLLREIENAGDRGKEDDQETEEDKLDKFLHCQSFFIV